MYLWLDKRYTLCTLKWGLLMSEWHCVEIKVNYKWDWFCMRVMQTRSLEKEKKERKEEDRSVRRVWSVCYHERDRELFCGSQSEVRCLCVCVWERESVGSKKAQMCGCVSDGKRRSKHLINRWQIRCWLWHPDWRISSVLNKNKKRAMAPPKVGKVYIIC